MKRVDSDFLGMHAQVVSIESFQIEAQVQNVQEISKHSGIFFLVIFVAGTTQKLWKTSS